MDASPSMATDSASAVAVHTQSTVKAAMAIRRAQAVEERTTPSRPIIGNLSQLRQAEAPPSICECT